MKSLAILSVAIILAACAKENENPDTTFKTDRFLLSERVNISITTLPQGTRCLLFADYPFDENGELSQDPSMVAYAPVDKDVYLPKSVSTCYIYANGQLYTYDKDGLRPHTRSAGAMSRADGQAGDVTDVVLSDAFITAAYAYFPEAQQNFPEEDRAKSTDLIVPQGEKIIDGVNMGVWGNAKVWITYVGRGGTLFPGSLWYYTYKMDGTAYVPATLPQPVPVFTTEENIAGRRVYLGEFEPGTHIGFIYQGNSGPRYSTPYYNNLATGMNMANGVTRKWTYTENGETKQYATLGMENRLPGEFKWDGDYNDMICLIEADPLVIENELPDPVPDPEVIKWQGLWLFEDNYPYAGDYDFNDLVVKYSITEYPAETVIDLDFMARGASYDNSFGVNGNIYFEHLSGYENVYPSMPKVQTLLRQIRVAKAEKYIPMMNNGRLSFDMNSYNGHDEDFPCVFEIPIILGRKFLWCAESVRIDAAYPRYRNWVNSGCTQDVDWYLDAPAAGKVWDK